MTPTFQLLINSAASTAKKFSPSSLRDLALAQFGDSLTHITISDPNELEHNCTNLLRQQAENEVLIVAGGDGSFRFAASQAFKLLQETGRIRSLAVFPYGTFNLYAANHGILTSCKTRFAPMQVRL